ncbi:MAG: sulfate adenylyltransferase subunit CysN [Thermodesulfobacteriota bacterium]
MTTAKEKTLLRFSTTGSVDDGKSTLIGRLLYETKAIFEDQYAAIEKTSRKKGLAEVDLALLLDGLSAEREQGITIDVAHRYFETATRKFIITDSPGHVQYTRNMISGASTANCAIILIDARNGVLTQSKRHGFIVSLLRIPHLVVAINKMDLVEYSENVYNQIVEQYTDFSEKLDIQDMVFIPVSALKGDNVVEKSVNMPWYEGGTLLHYLETVHISADRNLVDFRFPVQYVLRPHQDFRGFAGKIVSGTLSPGEEIVVLPSGKTTRVRSVVTYDGELSEAFTPESVVLTLEDEVDVSRGDMMVRKNNLPQVGTRLEGMICWMDDIPMAINKPYLLQHTTRIVKAFVSRIVYQVDVNNLHRHKTESLSLNDIGRVELQVTSPIFCDSYKINRGTGCFILIDPLTHHTVAAGMIRGLSQKIDDIVPKDEDISSKQAKSPHTVWRDWNIDRHAREALNLHKAAVLWLTGLSGAGKSTVAMALEKTLFEFGCQTMLLDGDQLRHGLSADLGFSGKDREENIRRAAQVARLFFESGHLVICTFISPFARDRAAARSLIPEGRFFEIYVSCDLEVCKYRDPNGLYEKAMRGEIKNFTGVSSPYEAPDNPEILLNTDLQSVGDSVACIIDMLKKREIIRS